MHRTFILVALMLVILSVTPVAFGQTPVPASAGSCAPLTPCTDTASSTGLKLSGLAVDTAAPAAKAAAATVNTGFGLAWAIMALLVLALVYAIVAAVFATAGRDIPTLPEGSRILIPVLSVLGLGVAFYLTYVETKNVSAVCGPVGDCNAVQSSPFAKLFGFLPVGLLGLLGYVGIIVAWFVARSESAYGRIAALLMFGMALFGVLFTIYLTYLELFVIHAVCIWCLSSAVLMALILMLSVGPTLEALQSEELEPEEE
jgi:uncharacterized membrane protein